MINFITSSNPTPFNWALQEKCLNSFKKDKSNIYSVNSIIEAKSMSKWNQVVCYPTDLTAFDLIRRNVPSFTPIIKLSQKLGDTICIINSDIFIPNDSIFWKIANDIKENEFWFGRRTDVDDIEVLNNQNLDIYGFDYFIFKTSNISGFLNGSNTFYFGEPCWDFWLPIRAIQMGMRCFRIEKKIVFHQRHVQYWPRERYEMFGSALKWWLMSGKEQDYSWYYDVEGLVNWSRNYIYSNSYCMI